MKKTMLLIAALALVPAPAAAQNEAENAALSDNAVNATVAVPDNTVAAENATMAPPVDMNMAPVEEPAPPPAPAPRPRSFPYGLIGLVGLVGLLGRRRRD
jgi:MYXO-CTERM domain-containing protein